MLKIAGRPRRLWSRSLRVVGDTLVLRLDDDNDAEYWEEIVFDRDELRQHVAALFAGDEDFELLADLMNKAK